MVRRKYKHICQYAVDGFDKNFSYVIWNHLERSVAVVDPTGDMRRLFEDLTMSKYGVEFILLTHSHADHTEGLLDLLGFATHTLTPKIIGHNDFQSVDIAQLDTFTKVGDGHKIHLGSQCIEVLSTPGHIKDAVCFYLAASESPDGVGKVLTGDTLFVGGCGRTTEVEALTLFTSLKRLKKLPEETVVYPGHDYGSQQSSTIAHEKKYNRFLQSESYQDFMRERFPQ